MESVFIDGAVKVGEIGVDAGLCWVGDPCYILHKTKKELPKSLGKDWLGFVNKLEGHATLFNYDLGHGGLGVAVSTGHGDGSYPVYVVRGRCGNRAIIVDFDDVMVRDRDNREDTQENPW